MNPIEPSWTLSLGNVRYTSTEYDDITIIDHRPSIPYNLKFHWSWLFNLGMRLHVKWLMKQLTDIDLVWSFDLTNSVPLSFFDCPAKVFFAADWPPNDRALWAAKSCDLLVSVAQEILMFTENTIDYWLIIVLPIASLTPLKNYFSEFHPTTNSPLRIGITGNLLRPDIDRKTLLEIISNHPDCSFEFYGPTSIHESNIGGSENDATSSFLQELRQFHNTQLHGALSPQQLALEYCNIDAFLICYDPKQDQSKATNYHKIAEFLTYGSPVISNYVSAYDFEDSGVFMVGKNENYKLPVLFKDIIEKQHQRFHFDPTTYIENTRRILKILK